MYFNGALITGLTGLGPTKSIALLGEVGIEDITSRQLSHNPGREVDLVKPEQQPLLLNALTVPVTPLQEKAALNFTALEGFFTERLGSASNPLAVGTGAIPDAEVEAELDTMGFLSGLTEDEVVTEEPDGALDFLSSLGGDEPQVDEASTDNPLDFLENGPDEPVSYDRSALEKDDATPPWSEDTAEDTSNVDSTLDAIFGGTL